MRHPGPGENGNVLQRGQAMITVRKSSLRYCVEYVDCHPGPGEKWKSVAEGPGDDNSKKIFKNIVLSMWTVIPAPRVVAVSVSWRGQAMIVQ